MTGQDRPVRVLVTGAGGPSAIAVMRSLGSVDGVEIHAADMDRHAAGLYLVPPAQRSLVPRGDGDGFADALLAHCRTTGIDVLIPTVDQELLPIARARPRFLDAGVRVLLAGESALDDCLDKWRLARRCEGVVPIPRTALLDASFDASTWQLPFVVKPRRGSGSRDVTIIHDVAMLAPLPRDGCFLVQEYLPGEEHSLDVLATASGEVLAVVPRLRLRVDSGVAVAARTVHDERLESLGRQVVEVLGLSWVSNVQVRADVHGAPRLLEVNPRFPGTLPLTIAAGIDMPRICLALALGGPPPTIDGFRDVAMVRYLEHRMLDIEEMEAVVDRSREALTAVA